MSLFRRIYRIIAFILWTLFLFIVSSPYRGPIKSWGRTKRIIYFAHLWAKGLARIVNLRVKVHGGLAALQCKIADTPAGLIVSNHLGYLDILTHGSIFQIRYSPKSDIAKWFVFGGIVGLSHPVWIRRDSFSSAKSVSRDFAETIRNGINLIVYPEGTSSDGTDILPFKSSPFEAAAQENLPVLPILTKYKRISAKIDAAWHGDMTFLPHLWQILGVPFIEAEVCVLPPVYPEGRSRKEVALYVHDLMRQAHVENHFSIDQK